MGYSGGAGNAPARRRRQASGCNPCCLASANVGCREPNRRLREIPSDNPSSSYRHNRCRASVERVLQRWQQLRINRQRDAPCLARGGTTLAVPAGPASECSERGDTPVGSIPMRRRTDALATVAVRYGRTLGPEKTVTVSYSTRIYILGPDSRGAVSAILSSTPRGTRPIAPSRRPASSDCRSRISTGSRRRC